MALHPFVAVAVGFELLFLRGRFLMASEEGLARRVIVHGGMPKTGSSSIQSAFCSGPGRAVLSVVQIQLLTTPTPKPSGNYSRYVHSLRGAPRWLSPTAHSANIEAMSAKIRDTLASLPTGHTVLISAEAFGEVAVHDGDGLQRIRDYLGEFFTDFTFMAYIREPLSYACSRSQQGLKSGYPPRNVLKNAISGCDVATLVRNSNKVFGPANVSIRPFDPALMTSPDVVVDFAINVLGITQADAAALAGQQEQLNSGLPMDVLEILLQLYQEKGVTPENIRSGFVGALGRLDWAGTRFGPAFFTSEERSRLLDATDKVRAEASDLLGYDPFPSYRPFSGSSWDPGMVAPQVHARNCELLREAIAARRMGQRPKVTGNSPDANPAIEDERRAGDGATRAAVLELLGELYDLCPA